MSVIVDTFADIRILRYDVPGFSSLPLRQKIFLYYLSEAALWGRDILWLQNYGEAALRLRSFLEKIYVSQRSKGVDSRLAEYLKRIWFANGLHHHYSNDKFSAQFSAQELKQWAVEAGIADEETVSAEVDYLEPLLHDMTYRAKKVCLDEGVDLVASSAVNFYGRGVSQKEVEEFYASGKGRNALNSRVSKDEATGRLQESVWKIGGMYGEYIERIVGHLKAARGYSTCDAQEQYIDLLIKYYKTGDLADFDEYNKAWVAEKSSPIDFINGFIEVYNDPLGLKASWESIVELKDEEASKHIELIAANAQWFEDHSPVDERFRKKTVSGVSMNVIDVVMLGGDCYPATPIGVNLPNADWIREQYGSKSISLGNITHAYGEAAKDSGVMAEFTLTEEEKERSRKYSRPSDDLHTQLHECLGHGSGQMQPGITLDNLKAYGSTLEEARADLYALYFMADPKMVELGLVESLEVAWAHYDGYLRSGAIVQLSRIQKGRNIEESHMRNRALIARWVLEKAAESGVARMEVHDGKHYTRIYDYEAVRNLFGELLREVQRIKSTGDYEAARSLVETYGVKIDPALHDEVLSRYAKLGVPPFSGFVNPQLEIVCDSEGSVVDVVMSNDEAYDDQMLRYSNDYSFCNPSEA